MFSSIIKLILVVFNFKLFSMTGRLSDDIEHSLKYGYVLETFQYKYYMFLVFCRDQYLKLKRQVSELEEQLLRVKHAIDVHRAKDKYIYYILPCFSRLFSAYMSSLL